MNGRLARGLALGWLVTVALVGLLANVLPFQDPATNHLLLTRQGPTGAHWLGTDALGRDVLARMAFGARVDMIIGLGSVGISGVLGGALGMVAGYRGRWLGAIIMRTMDALLAFPALILALALVAFLGPSTRNVIIVISIVALPAFVRIARAGTISVAGSDFVIAAQAYGARGLRIMAVEIWPSIRRTMATFALALMAISIIVEGALSFLGAGVPQPQPSWGAMIAEGIGDLTVAPLTTILPSFALFLTVACLNVMADSRNSESVSSSRLV